jgi:glycosyltransferase involved in cell wall biosynthesis
LRKLVIISHTDHQTDIERGIVGWGPTVNEINHLSRHFDEIEHVACHDDSPPKGGSLPYADARIRLRPIPPFGGNSLGKKLSVLLTIPRVLTSVRAALKGATHVQLRLPMGIGIYLLPFFMFRRKESYVFWVKYANDWGQRRPPLGYALQRWMLKRNLAGCKVTINGFWEGQQPHCLSFENPCLTVAETEAGKSIVSGKSYERPFTFAFVGRMEDGKGVSRILEALKSIDPSEIGSVHFMGDGRDMARYAEMASHLRGKAVFHGFCKSDFVRDTLKSSHFFLLPTTASEGFPKAVAEAACHGCIPLVSDIGSIPHYVKDGLNGFVWKTAEGGFTKTLRRAVETDAERLRSIAEEGVDMSRRFTFERYCERLESKIFAD